MKKWRSSQSATKLPAISLGLVVAHCTAFIQRSLSFDFVYKEMVLSLRSIPNRKVVLTLNYFNKEDRQI